MFEFGIPLVHVNNIVHVWHQCGSWSSSPSILAKSCPVLPIGQLKPCSFGYASILAFCAIGLSLPALANLQ